MPRKVSRRQFIQTSLVFGTSLTLNGVAGMQDNATPEATPESSAPLELTGAIYPVHDPVIIKSGDYYYVFCTGGGIPTRRSADLLDWKIGQPSQIFMGLPGWASEAIPGAGDIWAPDISYFNDKYHIYYSVSTFGSSRSVIGLVTNPTLDRDDDNFRWTDEGLVVESLGVGDYNAIDANLVLDMEGAPWLVFGSHWSGIKMRRLDYETGKVSDEDTTLYSLAERFENHKSIEGPFIIRKGDFYYLFVSFDQCCQGTASSYRVMVGRSEALTGPYVDRDGVAMLEGGGTQVTFPSNRWRGPGHNSILQEGGIEYIVYHSYDAQNGGAPTLRIQPLVWDADGWPSATPPEA